MDESEKALEAFKGGLNCSQAVLSVCGARYGIDRATALRVGLGFGAGMGRMCQTCGAVTGAYMVIGLKYGMGDLPFAERKERAYAAVQRFSKEFKARNCSITCRDLTGFDFSTPEGMKAAKEADVLNKVCPKLVRDAAEILAGMEDG